MPKIRLFFSTKRSRPALELLLVPLHAPRQQGRHGLRNHFQLPEIGVEGRRHLTGECRFQIVSRPPRRAGAPCGYFAAPPPDAE